MNDTYFIKHKKYLEQIKEDVDAAEEVFSKGKINLKSFDLHDDLNDTFWMEDDELREDIREQLITIAHDFYNTLDIAEITGEDGEEDKTFDKYVKDILFVGSLTSFNYSSYADVDLHLLVDEDELTGGNELALNILKKYFIECKNDWNLKHTDLKIEGYDCELYVQDVNEVNASNGVYSLLKGKWIKHPEQLDTKNFDRAWIEKKSIDYIEQIDNLEDVITSNSDMELVEKAKESLKNIKDKIVQGRRDSLANGEGEMNKYNILFKILRRSGHIGKINDLLTKSYDRLNSIKKESKMQDRITHYIVESEQVDPMVEFRSLYGVKASKALEQYLQKRSNKDIEQVLTDDDEFDKFSNWALRHLNIDVYANFNKNDSELNAKPEKSKTRYGDTYSVVDGDNGGFDNAYESLNEDDNSSEDNKEEDGEKKEEEKGKVIVGKIDDETSMVILTNEPKDKENNMLKKIGGDKWEKDTQTNYWSSLIEKPANDIQNSLKSFEKDYSIEMSEL